MATWSQFADAAPALAQAARELLDAHAHKTLATLRADGSPRISGIEAQILEGDLWFGSMPDARKALDLRRDPRFSLHSGSEDPPAWKGDAKVSGRVEEITDAERMREVFEAMGHPQSGPAHLFRCDLSDASTVRLGEPADHLVIDVWREGQAPKRIKR
jgi:general stress protein 26